MTYKRRIAINAAATYGRSLYLLLVGLFSSRWLLMSLGEVDYGLLSLVGGLIGFVTFFNGLLGESVARFYAFSIGEEERSPDKRMAIGVCRKWFSIAVVLHTVLPVLLVGIGYPAGRWAIARFLTIPPERLAACEWVWLFSCVSCFVGMVSVPFSAMYNAKQEIAELTVYSVVSTTVNIFVVYAMTLRQQDWLAIYAGWMMLLSVVPSVIIDVRAIMKYQECRFDRRAIFDRGGWREILGYAGIRFFGALSQLFTSQGMTIAVNKILGPAKNAAMAVGSNLKAKTLMLNASFRGALAPAITNAAGRGDLGLLRKLVFRSCLLCAASVLLFALPMAVEADYIMRLWLKTPPSGAALLCKVLLAAMFFDQLTMGHVMGLFAMGRIVEFQLWESVVWIMALFIAVAWMFCGGDIVSVGIGYFIMYNIDNCVKLYCARKRCGISVRLWFRRIFAPLLAIAAVSLGVACLPRLLLGESFFRLLLTTAIAEISFIPLAWKFALSAEERLFVRSKMKSAIGGVAFRKK